jgi:multisubunit Na+/H+ antiporter MnhG subunit
MIAVTSVAYLGCALWLVGLLGLLRGREPRTRGHAAWLCVLGVVLLTLAFARAWGRDEGHAFAWAVMGIGLVWSWVLGQPPSTPATGVSEDAR